MGASFTDHVYQCKPEVSYRRIFDHVQNLFPECDEKTIERFLTRGSGSERSEGQKAWLVPSNYHYYNVIEAFHENEVILWKQGNDNIRVGDLVYLYVGVPFSAILFKTEVTEVDIPYTGEPNEHVVLKKLMRIKRLAEYPKDRMPLSRMKNFDVVTVRATRSMPLKLMADLDGIK